MHDDEIEHIILEDEDREAAHRPAAHAHHGQISAVESPEEYKKLGYILLGILLTACLLTFVRGIELRRFLSDFMAVFFITFAAFKFADLEGFAHAFRAYDVLAKRIRPWGYIYPFIEAFLGFWYPLSKGPQQLNVLALAFTGVAGIGVLQHVRRSNKTAFQCACLGTFIRLPLSKVSLLEDVAMFIMAGLMLVVK